MTPYQTSSAADAPGNQPHPRGTAAGVTGRPAGDVMPNQPRPRLSPRAGTTKASGFSMLEIFGIGVVVAVLCAMLVTPIYNIVDDARLAADLRSIASYTGATQKYFENKGTFAGPNGSVLTWTNGAYEYWDTKVLLPERYLDRTITTRLGTAAYIRLTKITASSSGTALTTAMNIGHIGNFNGNNGLYDLTSMYSAIPAPDWGGAWVWNQPTATRGAMVAALRPMPFSACYNLPTGTTPPPAVPGVNPNGVNPQYPGFDPYSQTSTFASQDPSNPTIVAELVLEGVKVGDAYRLSVSIDGIRQSMWAYWDVLGRVKYDMYNVGNQTQQKGDVFIYLGKVPPQ